MEKNIISREAIDKMLDSIYTKCVNGIPHVSPGIEEFANEYLSKKNNDPVAACKAMIRNQTIKCTTSGFLTGFGGLITLPVTIPANISSVLYVQMRMIACTAYLAGFDLSSDYTQTFIYACLAGVAVNEALKKVGTQFTTKVSINLIKKIPGSTLTKINQKVGFRFLTKFGEKGLINFGKAVPAVGALVGGGLDFVETKIIANRAYRWFFENDFEEKSESEITDIITDDTNEDSGCDQTISQSEDEEQL